MDFGALDEAIGQELTEGGGFSDPAMVSVCLSSAWCSLSEALRKENVPIFFWSCVELLISMMEMKHLNWSETQ